MQNRQAFLVLNMEKIYALPANVSGNIFTSFARALKALAKLVNMFPETFASSAYIFSMFSSFAIQKALFPKAKYVAVVLENMEGTCP